MRRAVKALRAKPDLASISLASISFVWVAASCWFTDRSTRAHAATWPGGSRPASSAMTAARSGPDEFIGRGIRCCPQRSCPRADCGPGSDCRARTRSRMRTGRRGRRPRTGLPGHAGRDRRTTGQTSRAARLRGPGRSARRAGPGAPGRRGPPRVPSLSGAAVYSMMPAIGSPPPRA